MKQRIVSNFTKILCLGVALVFFLPSTLGVVDEGKDSPLLAGRNQICVGNVHVEYPMGNSEITVTYTVDGDWIITEANLAISKNSLDGIPQTKKGNPKIGHFPYKLEDDSGATEVVFSIDLNDISNNGIEGTYYIAAHAVVEHPICGCETAWADTGYSFPGNSWALYFTIEIE